MTFRTKPELAQDILADMVADQTMPPRAAGDEVYGRSGPLRTFLQDNGIGYAMRVGCAFHYAYVPPGQLITLTPLVRVACLRWPVEEGFEFGKDHFGLDHSQVRLYTALLRHIVLTLAALAVCAITATLMVHALRVARGEALVLLCGHHHRLIPAAA